MNSNEAWSRFINYFQANEIPCHQIVDDFAPQLVMTFYNQNEAPNNCVEGTLFFYDGCIEARVYYDAAGQKWCRESEHKHELMRLFNYINARVFVMAKDGADNALFDPQFLYDPRLYMTEDDCFDITLTFVIPYKFYELAPLETETFYAEVCPKLLNDLALPIFFLLLGEWTIEQSINFIDYQLLSKNQ